jgi:hypothetical protein
MVGIRQQARETDMILTPTRIRTNSPLVTFNRDEMIFSAEDSTLRANGLAPGRVYNDAWDTGYTLVSHVTGKQVAMVEHHREVREGDLEYIDYVPAHEVAAIVRGRRPCYTLRVYND